MLQAISEMLKFQTDDSFKTQVKCAKTILDKVIEGLPNTPSTSIPVQVSSVHTPINATDLPPIRDCHGASMPKAEVPPKKEELKGPVQGKYKIVKNASNRLIRIEGLPLDAKIELDGKVITHEEARGKEFIHGRIL